MRKAFLAVGANLDGVFVSKKDFLNGEAAESREAFGDKKGVIKTTASDVVGSGGERDENGIFW